MHIAHALGTLLSVSGVAGDRSDAITLFIDGKSPPSHKGPCPSAFEESSDAALGKEETRQRKEGCLSILPPFRNGSSGLAESPNSGVSSPESS